jgi:hypothetical protein
METTVNEMVKLMDEMKELVFKMSGTEFMSAIADMDENTFKMMQISVKLMDAANDVMLENAKMMDSMNEKLDKLLLK